MKRRPALAAVLLLPLAARAQPGMDRPQPRLPVETLVVLSRGRRVPFRVEMAVTPETQMIGMMFRTAMEPDEGMLFDWGSPRESAMWMRNTLIPLDMLFIAADGRIHRIHDRATPQSLATIESRGPVRATLELQGGASERFDLRVGDRAEHRIFGRA